MKIAVTAAWGVEKRAGDYRSEGGMRVALQGIDTVIMISAPVAGGTERIPLHRNVINAARSAGVRRLLFTSVIGNGAEMDTLFGATQQVNRQTEARRWLTPSYSWPAH